MVRYTVLQLESRTIKGLNLLTKKLFFVFRVFLLAALLLTQSFAPVLASGLVTDNSDAEEDEDANVAVLTLVGSSVSNGARNVPLNPIIQLNFTKNVVNFAVAVQNASCFHLVDNNGVSIPINIIFPDDQMQRDVRRSIFVTPEENLHPNTIYTLAVDNTLISRNNDRIDDAHNITFKTGAQISDNNDNPLLISLGMNILSFSGNLPMNENSVPGSSPTSSVLNRPGGNSRLSLKDIDTALLARGILIIAVITLALITVSRLRKKRAS